MTRRALWGLAFAALVFALAGCAGGRRFAVEPRGEAVAVGESAARLAAYNAPFRQCRLAGSLLLPEAGRLSFGARVFRGLGARLDALAGLGRTAFSLTCLEGGECGLYLPGEGRYLLRQGGRLPGFLSALLTGRVPGDGQAVAAWRTPTGGTILRLETKGGWAEVAFDREEGLPRRVLYGPLGGEADAELRLDEFKSVEGHPFPHLIRIRGVDEDAFAEVSVDRVLPAQAGEGGAFKVLPPPGVEATRNDDDALWARLVSAQ